MAWQDTNNNGVDDKFELNFQRAAGTNNPAQVRAFTVSQPAPVTSNTWRDVLSGVGLRPAQTLQQQQSAIRSAYASDPLAARQRQALERFSYILGLQQQAANQAIQQGYGGAQQAIAAQAGSVAGAANRGAATLQDIYGNVGANAASLAAGRGLSSTAGQTAGLAGPGAQMAAMPNVARATGDVTSAGLETMGRYGAGSLGSAATAAGRAGGAAQSGLDQWLSNLTAGKRLEYDLYAAERVAEREAAKRAELQAADAANRTEVMLRAMLTGSLADKDTWNRVKKRAEKFGIMSFEDAKLAVDTYGATAIAALLGLQDVLVAGITPAAQ